MKMVRSDLAASGVMFSLDTETGFRDVVFVTGAYGLGENVVQGAVDPDEFYVHKPTFRAGHRAVLRRLLGDKAVKMIFVDGEDAARRRNIPTDRKEPRAVLPHRRGRARARRPRDARSRTITAPRRARRWTWSGPRTASTASSTSSRPARRRWPRAATAKLEELSCSRGRGEVLAEGRAVGEKIASARRGVIDSVERPRAISSPARCWSPTRPRPIGSR